MWFLEIILRTVVVDQDCHQFNLLMLLFTLINRSGAKLKLLWRSISYCVALEAFILLLKINIALMFPHKFTVTCLYQCDNSRALEL